MSTILFNDIVFGPIKSRRLGTSLGINLLPLYGKRCSFDCVYCECGFNKDFKSNEPFVTVAEVNEALEHRLQKLKSDGDHLDVITFAGNGEPTMHPKFGDIIDNTIALRNKYFPKAKISVLSNGMHVNKQSVVDTLKKVDNNILKLDSGILKTAVLIDRPNSPDYSIKKQVELFKQFGSNFILQTMFLRGSIDGKEVDNTTEDEVNAWLDIIKELKPREVMIYSLDRETPMKTLKKVPVEDLHKIAEKVKELGIEVNVAG